MPTIDFLYAVLRSGFSHIPARMTFDTEAQVMHQEQDMSSKVNLCGQRSWEIYLVNICSCYFGPSVNIGSNTRMVCQDLGKVGLLSSVTFFDD